MSGHRPLELNEDRLFPAGRDARPIARRLYRSIRDLPVVSPHGHTDPRWFADDVPFPDPAQLLITPDHYVTRMLYSQGVALERLGVRRRDGGEYERDGRKIWRLFAERYHLFLGTPSRIWLNHVFHDVFGFDVALSPATADLYYDRIDDRLKGDDMRPRALLDRFNIEVIATTESALDPLTHHRKLDATPYARRVITTFRPDDVVNPDREGFARNVAALGELTGQDTMHWNGYLAALKERRRFFKAAGATATDHGHPTARTADLDAADCEALLRKCLTGRSTAEERELFRAQMLTEMARMSLEDGLVMQIHAGAWRDHNRSVYDRFGPDVGGDIPRRSDFVGGLRPLLQRFGNERDLTIILFTLDESVYARELAPLAGHYPVLKLGPPWWFHDSPEGMRRFRRRVTETAGFYNTVGFNDDTRAFLSIPARHDVARRMDCACLAELVVEHRLGEDEAADLAVDLTYNLVTDAYRISAPRRRAA